MLAPGEMGECGVPAGQAFAGNTKMEQSVSRGPVGWVRGPGSRQRYQGDREAVPVLRFHDHACACEHRECCVFACTSDLLSLPAEDVTVSVFYVSPSCGCCCRQHLVCGSLCDWLHQGPPHVCVCVRVCASLGCVLSFTTSYTCRRESGSWIPQPGQRLQIPRHQAGLQQPGRTVLGVTGLYWASAAQQEWSSAGTTRSGG